MRRERTINQEKQFEFCIKHLGCQPSSFGFEAEWHPASRWTQVFSAPLPAYTAPHFSHSAGESVDVQLKSEFICCNSRIIFHCKTIWSKNLCGSLLSLFPPAYGSVEAWAFCSVFLLFSLSLKQDALSHCPVLQRKVTDGFAEVLCFGVSHHCSGVAQE